MSTQQFLHAAALFKAAVVETVFFEDVQDANRINRIVRAERVNVRAVAPMFVPSCAKALSDAADREGFFILNANRGAPSLALLGVRQLRIGDEALNAVIRKGCIDENPCLLRRTFGTVAKLVLGFAFKP
ncbi:MAG: hypothetical protein HYV60_14935 [Planctomycetia bacterium]|nr:hypothetical protein [Planctomycetia bacterium]